MADITFPLLSGGDVTVDVADIVSVQPAGGATLVNMKNEPLPYRSPAPHELIEQAIANGGGPVLPATDGPAPRPNRTTP